MEQYTISINGEKRSLTADADTPLLWVLRENLFSYGVIMEFDERCPVCGGDWSMIEVLPNTYGEFDLEEDDTILRWACENEDCGWTGKTSGNTSELLEEDFFGG